MVNTRTPNKMTARGKALADDLEILELGRSLHAKELERLDGRLPEVETPVGVLALKAFRAMDRVEVGEEGHQWLGRLKSINDSSRVPGREGEYCLTVALYSEGTHVVIHYRDLISLEIYNTDPPGHLSGQPA